jgi:hypothetical protein
MICWHQSELLIGRCVDQILPRLLNYDGIHGFEEVGMQSAATTTNLDDAAHVVDKLALAKSVLRDQTQLRNWQTLTLEVLRQLESVTVHQWQSLFTLANVGQFELLALNVSSSNAAGEEQLFSRV